MAKLGDIITQVRGVSYKPEDVCNNISERSIGLLRANNIKDGHIILDDIVYVNTKCVSSAQHLKAGDILVCTSSGSKDLVGKAAYVETDLPMTFGAFCKVVRPQNAYPKYIGQFFNSTQYRKKISDAAAGANINNIRNEHIDNLEVPLPPLDEQQHIAAVLDKAAALIDLRKQQLAKLDELVKARFVEMFGDPESNTLHWTEQPLSDHLNVVGGYAFKSDQFAEEGIPVLRIGNINAGFFKPVNLVFWEEDEALNRYKMYPGDLVMSLTGTVGKDDYGNVCILGNDYDEYYLNQRNAKLELKESINKYYLSTLLKFEPIKKKLTGISRGVRQANISNKDILNLVVPIPEISKQNEFEKFVQQLDKSKAAIQKSLDEAQLLFDSQMQKYFG